MNAGNGDRFHNEREANSRRFARCQSMKAVPRNRQRWRKRLLDLRWLLLAWAVSLSTGWVDAAQSTREAGESGPTVMFAEGELRVEASNAPVATLLRRIAQKAGVDIAVYGEPESTISIRFESLRLDDALRRLLGQYDLVLLYKEIKDAPPDGPRARLTGVQVHVEPGINAPTMSFQAGQVFERRIAARKREERIERLREIKQRSTARAKRLTAPLEGESPEIVARLKVAAFDSDPSIRADAVDEISMFDDERAAADILERVLREDPNPEVRANAISGLEDLDAPPVETVLDAVLFDESPEVRIGAMEIIGDHEWKDQRTIDTLSRVLNDDNQEVRLSALEILDELEERRVIETAARSSPHQDIRELATELLR